MKTERKKKLGQTLRRMDRALWYLDALAVISVALWIGCRVTGLLVGALGVG